MYLLCVDKAALVLSSISPCCKAKAWDFIIQGVGTGWSLPQTGKLERSLELCPSPQGSGQSR